MKISSRVLAALLCAAPLIAAAQVSYDTAGSTYLQNFNAGLPADFNNSAVWTQNSTFAGWYANFNTSPFTPTTYRLNALSDDSRLQHFRANGTATNGAFGSRPGSTSGDIMYGLRLVNNTGQDLVGFSLGYTGEQWFNSDSGNNNNLVVAYQFGTRSSLRGGTWTNIDALTFNSIHDGDGAGSAQTATYLFGHDEANSQVFSPYTVNAVWAAGEELWIRWFDTNTSGTDHSLAIDNVTFTAMAAAIPEPSTYAALAGAAALGLACWRRSRRATTLLA